MFDAVDVVIILLQVFVLAGVVIAARKAFWATRMIESARASLSQEILENSRQRESLDRLYLKLGLPRGSLPPTRGWAASPDFLNILYDHILSHRPANLVECGSGLTTIVTACALRKIGEGRLVSLDHDANFAEKTMRHLRDLELDGFVDLHVAPLTWQEIDGERVQWYDVADLPLPQSLDLITVDGPPEPIVGPGGRYPVAPTLFPRLAAGGFVMFDDANRPGERKSIDRISEKFGDLKSSEEFTEKGLTLFCR